MSNKTNLLSSNKNIVDTTNQMNINEITDTQKQIYIWSQQPDKKQILDTMYSRYLSTAYELKFESKINDRELYYKFISLVYHLNLLQ